MSSNGARAGTVIGVILRVCYGLGFVAAGLVLAVGGARLLSLGGSAYYLPAGIAAALAGAAVVLGRWKSGAAIYGALMVATVAWALWESGLTGWPLAPRILSPAVLGLPLLVAILIRGGSVARSFGAAMVAGVLGVMIAGGLSASFRPVAGASSPAVTGETAAAGEWPNFGNTAAGTHFSPLAQITPANVASLKVAWRVTLGPVARSMAMQNQSVPLKIGEHLYVCTPFNDVYDLDPETGAIHWHFESKPDTTGVFQAKCRSVAYYAVPDATGVCAQRVYTASADGRLIALDADTGKPCADFGDGGTVNLLHGLKQRSPGYYDPTSGPTVVRGKLVVGAGVADGQYVGEPSGVIRAYDAVTGKLAWAWDLGRPGHHEEVAEGDIYTPSTPNGWGPMSADETLGLVFVPTGNATPDYWGGHRSAESNQYSSSLVALDADTGEPRWSFQTTHYDLWDYDVASQPVLFDLHTDAGVTPAVLQPTKRGQLFVLDRRTGVPIFPVEEKPAPQGGAVEAVSPTQPWSVAVADLGGPALTEKSMWGLTAVDQLWCRIKFHEARYDGPLTPPGTTSSIVYPGYVGGVNWGSASIDTARQLAFLPSSRTANYDRLIPRSDPIAQDLKADPTVYLGGLVAQEGTPFAADIHPFLSPLRVPCQQPPYGLINAVDLHTGKLVWSRPLGTARDLGPLGHPSHIPFAIGTPNFGGALSTASGLVFIAASQDHAFRAFDSATGKLLFEADLPAPGNSSPMTYTSGKGRQFVAISSEAPAKGGAYYYGVLTAFALPEP